MTAPPPPAPMNENLLITVTDGEEEIGTPRRRIVLVNLVSSDEEDLATDRRDRSEVNDLEREMSPFQESTAEPIKEFGVFMKLPIELRLQIWNWAFPRRIVNLIFDEAGEIERRFFSFNSSPPSLLSIHKETRELALKTYKSFGGSPTGKSVWVDFARDIILTNDDYKHGQLIPDAAIELGFDRTKVQNLAFSVDYFCHEDGAARQGDRLKIVVQDVLEKFTTLKKLYLVYEDGINPYSRGRIRFYPMERTCLPDCSDKGCINLAIHRADCQDAIDSVRISPAVLKREVDIRFVGAWRGGSRTDFGHAITDYEDESGDEDSMSENEVDGGWESDHDWVTPFEKNGRIEYNGYQLVYDKADEKASFSDHEGWDSPEAVPEHEVRDLKEDEGAYWNFAEAPSRRYDLKQGEQLSLTMRNMHDYYEWRKTGHPGKCYPIYHPDGTYRAV